MVRQRPELPTLQLGAGGVETSSMSLSADFDDRLSPGVKGLQLTQYDAFHCTPSKLPTPMLSRAQLGTNPFERSFLSATDTFTEKETNEPILYVGLGDGNSQDRELTDSLMETPTLAPQRETWLGEVIANSSPLPSSSVSCLVAPEALAEGDKEYAEPLVENMRWPHEANTRQNELFSLSTYEENLRDSDIPTYTDSGESTSANVRTEQGTSVQNTETRKQKRRTKFTPEQRRARRQTQNRNAASRCRTKKKEQFDILTSVVLQRELENDQLKSEIMKCRVELLALKEEVSRHSHCSEPICLPAVSGSDSGSVLPSLT
eukprot:comp4867_c0_seq1/m.977 comp4867_c0_seq1/g.977  ORF comp4867_c0_seq1/g.977 comp4867_c0_seq1/m.977 type:complete len:318 (-) comp4867_c0_seq1:203-1156(-)